MDSVFEVKQNRVLVMTRRGIYMYEGCQKSSWTPSLQLNRNND